MAYKTENLKIKKKMLGIYFFVALLFFIVLSNTANAYNKLDFSFHKLESDNPGPTVLIVAGIQGDEPGGFNAAAILATRYKITKGNVWIVPNLNFISIINRSRGVYGDLNRKFADIKPNDPEYETVQEIKQLILNENVDLVLNLHDGSGFYNHNYIDSDRNPDRWGQSLVIDQEHLENTKYGNLHIIAKDIVYTMNSKIKNSGEKYSIHNTRTCEGNEEMSKTLTYFAVCNRKSAFGLEVSKSFPTHKRAYYHLLLLETFMNYFGIEYEKDFALSFVRVKDAIDKDINISLNSRIFLEMENARKNLRYIPIKKDGNIEFSARNPLLALIEKGKKYQVFYGNRNISYIYPEFFEYDGSLDSIDMVIDEEEKKVDFGKITNVKSAFKVMPIENHRVNIIGFVGKNGNDESGIEIRKKDFLKRFSVDKSGSIYRVEVYKNEKFSGMVLVKFIV